MIHSCLVCVKDCAFDKVVCVTKLCVCVKDCL